MPQREFVGYIEDSKKGSGDVHRLITMSQPDKTAYKPGEEISYSGARFEMPNGRDVTSQVKFSVFEGSAFKKNVKTQEVIVSYKDEGGLYETKLELRRKVNLWPVALVSLLVAVTGAFLLIALLSLPAQGDTGSYIIPKEQMSDEEAQEMLDEMAEKSRITVSLAPNMRLTEDGQLRVNFIVMEPNNGLSERLEVEQDGAVVYRSGVVSPGNMIEWCQSQGAHAGSAIATVYAVSGEDDTGNPVSVEVQITE